MRRIELNLTAALLLACCSCGVARSPEEVLGEYQLVAHPVTIFLQVSPANRYSEEIASLGRPPVNIQGKWIWGSGSICFQHFAIPRQIIPKDLRGLYPRKQISSGQDQQNYWDNWCLSAENFWGKKRLVVFPDFDVYFEMNTRRRSRQ
jgi:hypothetical protein